MSADALLHHAVGWALGCIAAPPRVADRAARALDRCVAALEATRWPGAAAYFSGLNADGFPIEFAFSSRDDSVRFTSEPAAPEVGAEQRFARAEALLSALGSHSMPAALREWIVGLQREGPLTWGGAVSGRHSQSGDRFKLYAEVPFSSTVRRPDRELAAARLERPPRLVMVGWESESDRLERYFRCDGLAPGELRRILASVGLGDHGRELERGVEEAWRRTAEGALASTFGLSLAGPREGTCDAISVFKEVNRVLGGDSCARARLLALVERLEAGSLDAYARLSAPLADLPGSGAHGMLAFTVARGRPTELRIGINPAAAFRAVQAEQRSAAS